MCWPESLDRDVAVDTISTEVSIMHLAEDIAENDNNDMG